MKKIEIIGSVYEYAFRVLLLLDELEDTSLDELQISIIDFMAIYAGDFIPDARNIHGSGAFRFAEFPAKRQLAREALHFLVRHSLIDFEQNIYGLNYKTNKLGKEFCKKLSSEYTYIYRGYIKKIKSSFFIFNTSELLELINQKAYAHLEVK